MELELIGKCNCECSANDCNLCCWLICIIAILIAISIIAFTCYKIFAKCQDTKLKILKEQEDNKKYEFEQKLSWEQELYKAQPERKLKDLELRIREFKEITYPSNVLSKVDNKKTTAEDVVSAIEHLEEQVSTIEEKLKMNQ